MNSPVSADAILLGIRSLGNSGIPDPKEAIEAFLERELRGLPMAEKVALVKDVVRMFSARGQRFTQDRNPEPAEVSLLLSLLLGNGVAASELSTPEASEKLAHSLNTVFDALNQIICVIQSTLLGRQPEIETIRHVIGSQIGGKGGESSLKTYLDQIQQAFLTSHKAFQEAALTIVGRMLTALDPDTLARETDSGLKFGPLRKAELFESYREKYRECRSWVDSGRFTETLLREFEKYCQKNYRERI